MYANLRVTLDREPPFFVHEIEITETEIVFHLDANTGESNYAEPAGEKRIPLGAAEINVQASY